MNKTILLLEDEPALIALYKIWFTRYGFNVKHYTCPSQAIRDNGFDGADIIISDHQMLDETSFDLLQYMKDNNIKLPFISQSGYENVESEAKQNGLIDLITEFVPKPVDLKHLTEVVYKYI